MVRRTGGVLGPEPFPGARRIIPIGGDHLVNPLEAFSGTSERVKSNPRQSVHDILEEGI